MQHAPPTIDPTKLEALLDAGDALWAGFPDVAGGRDPHLFVPCDARAAYAALRVLRSRATTFLELGAGAGVVTILADLLGFEATGIEREPWLVERARELAERCGSRAVFAEGSFVPPAYQDEIELLSGDYHTPTDGASAYDELDAELTEFDVVYAYPWPGEELWLTELMRRHGRADAILLTYGVSDGFRTSERGGEPSDVDVSALDAVG